MRAAKLQASLRIRAVSPEPPLPAHTSSESRETFRQKARSLAPLDGWACAVKLCHDGMLEDTNSLVFKGSLTESPPCPPLPHPPPPPYGSATGCIGKHTGDKIHTTVVCHNEDDGEPPSECHSTTVKILKIGHKKKIAVTILKLELYSFSTE